MDYPSYERAMELACQGSHVAEYMAAIFADAGSDANLASLSRRLYKDTEAGISLSYQLDNGEYIWPGDEAAADTKLVNRVSKIGFSSIVEESDCEVPLTWLDLLDESIDSAEKAVSEFNKLASETDDYACSLWNQEHEAIND